MTEPKLPNKIRIDCAHCGHRFPISEKADYDPVEIFCPECGWVQHGVSPATGLPVVKSRPPRPRRGRLRILVGSGVAAFGFLLMIAALNIMDVPGWENPGSFVFVLGIIFIFVGLGTAATGVLQVLG